MICRNCIHPFIPKADRPHEQGGINSMAKAGYRQCGAATTPEHKGLWVTGGNKCVINKFKAKEKL